MKNYFLVLIILFCSCKKQTVIDTTPINAEGEVLFISRRISNSADWQMFLMKADGTNQRAVSNNLVSCAPPVVSNNKTKIAFTTVDNNNYHNLFVMDIDGQNQKFLSKAKQFCGSPVWSNDDKSIAFVKRDTNNILTNHIYTININGSNGSNELKLTSQNNNFSPQYLNDNVSLVYATSINGWTGVYKMNIDGSNKQLLTPQTKSFSNPKVSPVGNLIAVTSYGSNGSQIFVINSNGQNLKQLTFSTSPSVFPGEPQNGNDCPSWSPNGNKLTYISYVYGNPDIFIINSNGTSNKRLTDTPLRDENPTWTKDGNYILFSSNRNPNIAAQIYIMRPEGQLQTQLTNYGGDNIYPTFIDK